MIQSVDFQPARPDATRNDIEALIARHGGLRVARSVLAALLRPNRAPPGPPDVRTLSNHLRRDIGLAQQSARPKPLVAKTVIRERGGACRAAAARLKQGHV